MVFPQSSKIKRKQFNIIMIGNTNFTLDYFKHNTFPKDYNRMEFLNLHVITINGRNENTDVL